MMTRSRDASPTLLLQRCVGRRPQVGPFLPMTIGFLAHQFLPRDNVVLSNGRLSTLRIPECIGCQTANSQWRRIPSQVVLHQARHMAHPPANVRMDITRRSRLVKPSSLSSAAEAGLKAPLQFNTAPLTLQVFLPLTSFTHSVI